jgi:leucyl/phenylalanyl-tRNA--protein transferase
LHGGDILKQRKQNRLPTLWQPVLKKYKFLSKASAPGHSHSIFAAMLTPNQVLHGYRIGIFPMADPDDNDSISWYEPKKRGIIPLDAFKVPKNLRRLIKQGKFEVTVNQDFEGVMRACAQREDTWISDEIIYVYTRLHEAGWGYSFEARLDGKLVGGLYGIAMHRAFFGESMFHTVTDASKVALVYLVEWMHENGLTLLDTQFITDHLKQFGAVEIPQKDYLKLLQKAIVCL